jgi:hypothetical protein
MARLKPQLGTALRNAVTSDTLDKEIKRLEVAAQTPKERRARRDRRYHMLRNKPVS